MLHRIQTIPPLIYKLTASQATVRSSGPTAWWAAGCPCCRTRSVPSAGASARISRPPRDLKNSVHFQPSNLGRIHTPEYPLLLIPEEIPHPERSVVRTGHELAIGRAEARRKTTHTISEHTKSFSSSQMAHQRLLSGHRSLLEISEIKQCGTAQVFYCPRVRWEVCNKNARSNTLPEARAGRASGKVPEPGSTPPFQIVYCVIYIAENTDYSSSIVNEDGCFLY